MRAPPHLEALIVELLRGRKGSICPSEVARAVEPAGDWRGRMQAVRDAARVLALQDTIEVLQRGRRLDPHGAWRGALRLARGPRFDAHRSGVEDM